MTQQIPLIQPSGTFNFDVVGESHYQEALLSLAGAKTEQRKDLKGFATLILEDDNPYDQNAVKVMIRGKQVGYLSNKNAPIFRDQLAKTQYKDHKRIACRAQIRGGWKDYRSEGHFGVKLDIPNTLAGNIRMFTMPRAQKKQHPKNKFSSYLSGKQLVLHQNQERFINKLTEKN